MYPVLRMICVRITHKSCTIPIQVYKIGLRFVDGRHAGRWSGNRRARQGRGAKISSTIWGRGTGWSQLRNVVTVCHMDDMDVIPEKVIEIRVSSVSSPAIG